MKYLLWLLLIALAVWAYRRSRPSAAPGTQATHRPGAPQKIVACAHCQVHLPRADSVLGAGTGLPYCSLAHCQAAGDQPAA